jgi:hypothetical protein
MLFALKSPGGGNYSYKGIIEKVVIKRALK